LSRCFPWLAAVLLAAQVGCTTADRPVRRSTAAPGARTVTTASAQHSVSSSPITRLTVNGETVEAADLWIGLHDLVSNKAATLSPADFRDYLGQTAEQLITDKIAEMLLHQHASLRHDPETDKGIDRFVDSEIRKIVTDDHGGIQRRYEKHLESQGQTLDGVRIRIRRSVMIARHMEQEVKPKVPEPSRADLLAAYQTNVDSWRRPARRSMSLIDVRAMDRLPQSVDNPTREQTAAARDEARSRIDAARQEIVNGAAFAEVAKRYSDGLQAAEGGAWGWVTPEGVRPRFSPALDALAKLDAGQVSEIIECPDGFFLVRCDELDPCVEPDFQSVQQEIRERHYRTAYNRLVVELVRDLRARARVEPANLESFHAAVVEAGMRIEPDGPR